MSNLTKWIKCRDQQPTLPGWYDVRWHGDSRVSAGRIYWTGVNWNVASFGVSARFSGDAWRGLSENPSAPKEAV